MLQAAAQVAADQDPRGQEVLQAAAAGQVAAAQVDQAQVQEQWEADLVQEQAEADLVQVPIAVQDQADLVVIAAVQDPAVIVVQDQAEADQVEAAQAEADLVQDQAEAAVEVHPNHSIEFI